MEYWSLVLGFPSYDPSFAEIFVISYLMMGHIKFISRLLAIFSNFILRIKRTGFWILILLPPIAWSFRGVYASEVEEWG